jgi:hypothetical protein
VHVVKEDTANLELCVASPASLLATIATSSSGGLTFVTPVSPCLQYADISNFTPIYMTQVPRDPSLATSSNLTGYTISRNKYNDITISAKSPENGAIIKVACNFNGFCKDIKYITSIIYDKPEIVSIDRNTFLRDATPKTPLIVKGKNFTKKNTIVLSSTYNSKEYILGTFTSTVLSTTSNSISIDGPVFAQPLACGTNCLETLPLGDYMMRITNEGGESNTTRIALRGFTTSSISTQINSTIAPPARNVKVGTITVSSSIPVTLTSLTLTSTSTSKNLASKISNFVIKDNAESLTYGGGGSGSFSFGAVKMFENQSKVYDVYIDTAEVYMQDAGFITYGGKLLVRDMFAPFDMELPIKEFSFTISH